MPVLVQTVIFRRSCVKGGSNRSWEVVEDTKLPEFYSMQWYTIYPLIKYVVILHQHVMTIRPFLGRSCELPGALCDSQGKGGGEGVGEEAHTVTGTFLWPSGPAALAGP